MRRDDPEPESRWGPMVLASVAIHALVIGGAVILASGSPPPQLLYAPSMSVGLVGPGEVGLPPGGGDPPGGPPVPPNTDRPREKSAPKAKAKAPDPPRTERQPAKKTPADSPRPKVEKPKPEITRALSLKPKPGTARPPKKRAAAPRGDAPPKKVKKIRRTGPSAVFAKTRRKPAVRKPAGKELDALDQIRKRLLARASRPAGRRGATGTGRRRGGPGKAGGGGFSGPGGRDSYKNELARIFYAAWVLPRSIPTEGLKVDLIIHIDRGGRIVKTDIKSPSGNRLFDESVLRAVAKVDTAGGLPPLPPGILESVLVQGFRFDPKFHRGFTR